MTTTGTMATDAGARPEEVARTLAQATLQAVARAMHTAQLAVDATRRTGNFDAKHTALRQTMEKLRDGVMDAYAAVPESMRAEILKAPGTIGGDELLDLLATLVRAREERTKDNRATKQETR